MKVETIPGADFAPCGRFESTDVLDFVESLGILEDAMPLFWKSNRDRVARPGLWLRQGAYRLKHGSFVDPSDLSAYAAQFYVADDAGRHQCLQLGHGMEAPADGVALSTVGELRAALAARVPAVAALLADGGAQAAEAAEEAPALRLLQPDAAFELHGSLTTGWGADAWSFVDEEGAEHVIIVFD